ncbi:MAG: hypothetical protein QXY96_07310, partial [Candidatus Methanomethylicaceae archaeon]
IELYGDSEMYLSTSAITKLEFEVPVNGLAYVYSPISLKIDGLDLNNTHPGGNITGYFFSYYNIENPSVEYSLDDGNTWNTAEWSQISPNNVGFVIKNVENSFVSLRVNATINDIKTSYTVIRGFYVGEMITLADFPEPFITNGKLSVILTPGSSDYRGPVNPAHTVDVAASNYIASILGRLSSYGNIEVYMDWEVASFDSSHVYGIWRSGNVITFGSPGVNLISYYLHHHPDNNWNPIIPAYFGVDAQGQYIYSTATGNTYRMINDYGQGKTVTDYSLIALYYDDSNNRYIMMIAGLSGVTTRETCKWIATQPQLEGKAMILKFIDYEGDFQPDYIEIIEIME